MDKVSIYQGDSSLPITVRPNIADPAEVISSDWLCRSAVICDDDGSNLIAPRVENVKTDDGLHWIIVLSPADTALIPVVNKTRKCTLVVEVTNDNLMPSYSREKHIELEVKKQGLI